MTDMMRIVTIGALLHDIGKAIIRASGERKTHSQLGADFLRPFCDISEAGEAVVRCVRYHHGRDLSGAHLTPDDLAYIVYEADNLAAGIDRRDRDDGTAAFGFDPELTLENVFNVFDGVKRKSYFSLQSLNAALPMNMPVADRPLASRGKYAEIVEKLSANFKEIPPQEMKGNELLRILEDTLSYVPSSTAKGEVCDISLFDHVKITAAVASSLLRYMQQHGIADYKNFCCTRGLENRKKDTLLFISADFSGIQKFIYRVQTKGAMRMLRGRSFYLAMVMEHIIDEILEKLSLSRANLIYSGGGLGAFLGRRAAPREGEEGQYFPPREPRHCGEEAEPLQRQCDRGHDRRRQRAEYDRARYARVRALPPIVGCFEARGLCRSRERG